MESMQLAGARTGVVPQDLPTLRAVAAVSLLAVAFGIHIYIWVDTAREGDNSILGIVPWLLYPGIVAAIAVRSRVEVLAIGLGAVLPVAGFGLFGSDRLQAMGIGVPLGYAALIAISVVAASHFARRRGIGGVIAALLLGAATFPLAFGIVVLFLLFVPPQY